MQRPGDLVLRIADTKPRKTHNMVRLSADRTLFAFAGLWARLCGAHGPKSAPKGQDGDRINAVLAAAGFNFHLLLRWLTALLRLSPGRNPIGSKLAASLTPRSKRFFTGDC